MVTEKENAHREFVRTSQAPRAKNSLPTAAVGNKENEIELILESRSKSDNVFHIDRFSLEGPKQYRSTSSRAIFFGHYRVQMQDDNLASQRSGVLGVHVFVRRCLLSPLRG